MALDDEELSLGEGDIVLRFNSRKAKDNFLKEITIMVDKSERIEEEGYKCWHCAAYPCFRMCYPSILEFLRGYNPQNTEKIRRYEELSMQEAMQPAGLCFQAIRRCRQECNNYLQKTVNGLSALTNGGSCKVDGREIKYEQECHIPKMRSRVE